MRRARAERRGDVGVPAAVWLTLAFLCFVAGCGGGNSPAASGGAKTGRGKATITLDWPAPSRLIPVAAQSVRVAVATPQGQELGARLLKRPPAGGITTAAFADLPVGTLTVAAAAFPEANPAALGVAQASALTPIAIQKGLTARLALTLQSDIAQWKVSPESWNPGGIGERMTFMATATNAAGQVVITAPTRTKWESSDPSVLAVDDNGAAVTLKPGSAS